MARPSSFSYTANTNVTNANVLQLMADTSNWKKTRKNSYSIWATIVQQRVEVSNTLEGAHYVTTPAQCVVLSGTRGEKWVTSLDKLAKTYYFSNSIDESLPRKAFDASNPNSATYDASQVINKKSIMARGKKGVMPWTSVTTIPRGNGYTNFCFHVPLSVKNLPIQLGSGDEVLANRDGVVHGLGDFVVCAMNPDGTPNIYDCWVVNGLVFLDTYNKVNIKGLPKFETTSISAKPDTELAALPKKVVTDESGNITPVRKEAPAAKAQGAPRNEYKVVAKYTKNGKSIVAYEIEEASTKKRQVIDKAALYWLIGRGQVEGLTVQIRGAKIGLLAKDGFSLDAVELKTINK